MKKFSNALLSVAVLGAISATSQAELIYGVTSTFNLVNFDSSTPGTTNTVGAISGLTNGQILRGIDFRPATGQLYAVSTNAANTAGELYTINLGTGAASLVGSGFALTGNTSARVSIDFNPVVDRLRVVTGSDQNLRVNPITGALAAADTSLAYDPSDPNTLDNIVAGDVAYTNNVAGATTTTLYTYDYNNDRLATIGGLNGAPSPNGGAVFSVGDSGFISGTNAIGFDISGATGNAYVSADSLTSITDLYSVNLSTGAHTLVGSLGTAMLDISVAASPVPEPATMAALGLGIAGLLRRKRNSK